MVSFIKKYQDMILYGFFGVLTTLVNILSYWFFAHVLSLGIMISTGLAWLLAVLFAYLTNRNWVFHSEASENHAVMKELISFFACRIATGVVDWSCMFIFVDIFRLHDVFVKTVANVLVIILKTENIVIRKLLKKLMQLQKQ